MSEFGGLWKHPNNPAGTESVRAFKSAEVGHYREEEEERIPAIIHNYHKTLLHWHFVYVGHEACRHKGVRRVKRE